MIKVRILSEAEYEAKIELNEGLLYHVFQVKNGKTFIAFTDENNMKDIFVSRPEIEKILGPIVSDLEAEKALSKFILDAWREVLK